MRRFRFSRILGSVVAAGAIVLAIMIWRSFETAPPPGPAPPCPPGYLDSPARGEALMRGLAQTREGAALIAQARPTDPRFCFAALDSSMLSGTRVLLIDSRLSPAAAQARLGHLIVHATSGLPFPESVPHGADCDALVRTAIAREAHAYAVEVRLERELGAPPRYEFEAAFWAAPADRREAVVREYLVAHPAGGPGIDALAAGYRQRCERGR